MPTTTLQVLYPLVAGLLTAQEITELRAVAKRIGAQHDHGHPRHLRYCGDCLRRARAVAEVTELIEAARMIPAGADVTYHGSIGKAHGIYVCGGLCRCVDCWGQVGRYRLLNAGGCTVLECVRPESVTVA
jgi:hypothetical protein